MKYYIFISMILSTSVFANDWYIGGGTGFSITNFSVEDKIDNYLQEHPDSLKNVRLLEFLGHTPHITSDMSDRSYKFFVGKQLNGRWSVEVSYDYIGKYGASANLDVNEDFNIIKSVEVPSYDDYISQYNLDITEDVNTINSELFKVDGSLRAKSRSVSMVSVELFSISAIWNWNPTDKYKLFHRIGASHIRGTLRSNTIFEYNYTLTGDMTESKSDIQKTTTSETITGIVPHFSAGVGYDFSKEYSMRIELTRYGYPVKNLRIDNVSIDFLYSF